MDINRVDMYIMANSKYFPQESVMMIRDKLIQMDERQFAIFVSAELKDPTVMLIISVFVGALGVDRFMLGDVGLGVLKLLTGGVCGILWLIDLFSIQQRTKEQNLQNVMAFFDAYQGQGW